MPRVRCFSEGCVYWEQGFCAADEIELDIQDGCLQFIQMENVSLEDEDWEDLFDDQEGFLDDDEEENEDENDYDPSEWN